MPGTGDGERTRALLLEAAVAVLCAEGAAGFSVPKVAAAVGIRQGTVTHYFPIRRDLLVATARHVADRYAALAARQLADLDPDDGGWAEALIVWLCDDAVVAPTAELFPELWSLARTDPDIAAAVAGIYDTAHVEVMRALGHDPADPGCAELSGLVWLLASVGEGMTAVHAPHGPDDPRYRAARDAAVAVLGPRLHAAHLVAPRGRPT